MWRYISCVMLKLLVLACVEARWLSCDNITDCTCDKTHRGLHVVCNSLNITEGEYSIGKHAQITCANNVNPLSSLTSTTLQLGTLHYLELQNCIPAAVSVRDIIDRLGIDSMRQLRVTGELYRLDKGQLANITNVNSVFMYSLGLTHIDWAVFGDENTSHSNIKRLFMSLNNISDLDRRVFGKLKRVTWIDLRHNHLTALPDSLFDNNSELTVLELGNNRLESIPRQLLSGLDHLKYLGISHNKLTALPDSLFVNKTELSRLLLSYNQLDNIPRQLLSGLDKLDDLDLSHNNLIALPDRLFVNNKRLITLDLRYNQLDNIQSKLFKGLNSLQRLLLSNNRIKSLGSEAWPLYRLQTLDLSHNQLTSIGDECVFVLRWCERLQTIHLTNNSLSSLGWDWSYLNSLQQITLSYNNFSTLPVDQLGSAKKPFTVHLDHNNITHVNLSLYQTGPINEEIPEITVNLENNPLVCDCHLHQFVSMEQSNIHVYLYDKRIHIQNTIQLQCDEPTVIKGRAIRDLSLEELTCPYITDQCPALCRCQYQPEGRYTVVDCRGVRLNSLPQSLPVHPDSHQTRLVMSDSQLGTFTYNSTLWSNVTYLDLSNTSLTSFTVSEGLGPLKKLNLSHNNLTSLSDLKSLDSFSLHDNPWRCECKDQELVELVSHYSKVDQLDKDPRTLKVYLDHNNIKHVNLSHLPIRQINDEIPNISVYLDSNPLVCDCHLHQFVKMVLSNEYVSESCVRIQNPAQLRCDEPKVLKGRTISELSLEELTCPCDRDSEGCKCQYQPEGRYTVVDCRGVRLNSLPQPQGTFTYNSTRWSNVTYLDLSNTSLTSFTVSEGLGLLKKLNLSHNNLTSLSDETVKSLKSLDSLSLHHNPWRCECEDQELVKLVFHRAKMVLENADEILCKNQTLMVEVNINEICYTFKYWFHVAVGLCVANVLLAAGLLALWYRNELLIFLYNSDYSCLRLLVSHPDDINRHLNYDAFISFTHEDDEFVVQHLLPQLDGRYKLCLHFRDWMPGEMIGVNVIQSILESRRTIIVMSPNYLRSDWGSYEFEIAHMEGFSTLIDRMIVIMYKDIDNIAVRESVSLYMRTVTYLKWDNTENFWNRLHYKMPHPPENSSRISCILNWCWRRERKEEGDLDRERLMEQVMRLQPVPLAIEPAQDHRESGSVMGGEKLMRHMRRVRNVSSVLRSIKDSSSYDPDTEDDADLNDLVEQWLTLRRRSLTVRSDQVPTTSTCHDETVTQTSCL